MDLLRVEDHAGEVMRGESWGIIYVSDLKSYNLFMASGLTDTIGWTTIHPIAYHSITSIDTMPVKGLNEKEQTSFRYRSIVYRLLPGTQSKAKKLAGLAGACQFVWNAMLA